MPELTPFLIGIALLALSACESAPPPKRGPYVNVGLTDTQLKVAIPCNTPVACNVASNLHISTPSAFGLEVGAGYRFGYLSFAVEGMTAGNGGGEIRERIPSQPACCEVSNPEVDMHIKTFVRPALRADLPITRRLTLYGSYGWQWENIVVHTQIVTGRIVQTSSPGYCDKRPPDDPTKPALGSAPQNPTCYPPSTSLDPEIGYNDYHQRGLRTSATIGFELYGLDLGGASLALNAEYLPIGNGRVGAVTVGCALYL